MKKEMTVVGLMSGTSLDGVDVAITKFQMVDQKIDFESLFFETYPFELELKNRLQRLVLPTAQSPDISSMNFLLGEVFGEAVNKAIIDSGLRFEDIDLVSSHGQTIFHNVTEQNDDPYHRLNTLQIGDISVIAERTGITTIGDFRTRDVAVGGQGAPLVPFADYTLFRSENFGRVLVNVGGITNLTVLPKGCKSDDVIAYDSGPGNMLIDAFVYFYTNGEKSFDENGKLASEGEIDYDWLNQLLKNPYYYKSPPKSTGREEFGYDYAKTLWTEAEALNVKPINRITTITALTSHTLAKAIVDHLEQGQIQEIYLSGGGWHNPTLVQFVEDLLPSGLTIKSTEELGIHSDAKEAIVFALLGFLGFNKHFNNLPAATGATKNVIMGKISW
ncbi:anhydro-N-acetylmuramic acid kinase [Piscibacillus halophilus]|uniref:Anhydro-N-acetylmuramic acid kinase n=1 Tax=Piscibacillus halophilus TaxID=571933 RepID=A0A1H9I220_9BACI|nr:anhydro-N-acetylmuramic acid kinase [Piscibacillus halophilus]SEQ68639.1 anhydro-N-acetylmuramic acid kinase [Piscibacillus halophilus]